MRHKRRDENEIPRPGLGDVFKVFAPAHPRAAVNDVMNAFEFSMMMPRRFSSFASILHGASPDFCAPRALFMAPRVTSPASGPYPGQAGSPGITRDAW